VRRRLKLLSSSFFPWTPEYLRDLVAKKQATTTSCPTMISQLIPFGRLACCYTSIGSASNAIVAFFRIFVRVASQLQGRNMVELFALAMDAAPKLVRPIRLSNTVLVVGTTSLGQVRAYFVAASPVSSRPLRKAASKRQRFRVAPVVQIV
jgi:hypothetical protein